MYCANLQFFVSYFRCYLLIDINKFYSYIKKKGVAKATPLYKYQSFIIYDPFHQKPRHRVPVRDGRGHHEGDAPPPTAPDRLSCSRGDDQARGHHLGTPLNHANRRRRGPLAAGAHPRGEAAHVRLRAAADLRRGARHRSHQGRRRGLR